MYEPMDTKKRYTIMDISEKIKMYFNTGMTEDDPKYREHLRLVKKVKAKSKSRLRRICRQVRKELEKINAEEPR